MKKIPAKIIFVSLLAGFLFLILLTLSFPWFGKPALSLPIIPSKEGIQIGDLHLSGDEFSILDFSPSQIWLRAWGPQPSIRADWIGSGNNSKILKIHLENINSQFSVEHSPYSTIINKGFSRLSIEAHLDKGPFSVSITIPDKLLTNGTFGIVGDSGNNSLTYSILNNLQSEKPLFVIHLGDLSKGWGWQKVAFREAFLSRDIPVFCCPGNHDYCRIGSYPLQDFDIFLNPTPIQFDINNTRFLLLSVGDFPICSGQLEWLQRHIKKGKSFMNLVFLHRAPIDLEGRDRELDKTSGVVRLEKLLREAYQVTTFSGHLHGFGTGTFAGHPYILSAGGGEKIKSDVDAYHHLLVSINGKIVKRVPYQRPTTLSWFVERICLEGPIFFRRIPLAAIFSLLLFLFLYRRQKGKVV